jgi:hypothetical protein
MAENAEERASLKLVDARDIERTFRAWLDLAKPEEVLVLFGLVQEALIQRGYAMRGEWKTDPPFERAMKPGVEIGRKEAVTQ